MDREAWWAVHGIAKSQTRLNQLSTHNYRPVISLQSIYPTDLQYEQKKCPGKFTATLYVTANNTNVHQQNNA